MEVYKSFCKVLTINAGTSSIVQLKDTTGSSVLCNFVRVEVAQTSPDNWFWAMPSGNGSALYASTTLNVSSTTASGAGVGGAVSQDLVEFVTQGGDRISSILLFNGHNASVIYAITYGVLKGKNFRADQFTSPGS